MSRVGALLLAGALSVAGGTGAAEVGDELHRLRFARETQNVEVIRTPLRLAPPTGVEVCPLLDGERWFGWLPHRRVGEPAESSDHALLFAAAYPEAGPPGVLFDFDGDRRLACGEELPMVALAERPGAVLRTFTVEWRDEGPRRAQRYRLSLPARHAGTAPPEVTIEAVDVPVARWTVGSATSLWVLHDGNFNGMIDRRFGDAVLVDPTGTGRLSLDPRQGDLRSLHLPIDLPWGRFRVAALELEGPTLVLARLPESAAGEAVEGLSCTDPRRGEVPLGKPDGRPQLVYFWLSQCGSCNADMAELGPLVERLGPERLRAVGVSFDETRTAYEDFLVRHDVEGWPHCFSGRAMWDNEVAAALGLFDAGSFVLFDGEGREVARGVRFAPLEEALHRLLGDPTLPVVNGARSMSRQPTKGGT